MSIPYVPQGTSKRFRVPRTLAADFTAFLNQDIPNTVMDFELVPDWYARNDPEYEKRYIRGEIYPDSTKSRYENTDSNMNFRADVNSGIKKGDMLVEPDGSVYVLDWAVHLQSNNAPSRALKCNMYLTIKRYVAEEVNDEGYLMTPEGYKTVVEEIPANAYRYDGRPEYSAVSGTPGIAPNALTIMTIQYNEQTKNIKESDRFEWGGDIFEVVDVNYVGLNIAGEYGTLKVQAKKMAGGLNGFGSGGDPYGY